MKKLVNCAFIYLFLGLAFGAFYREFTKFLGFYGDTMLSVLHTHTFALGAMSFILLVFAEKLFCLSKHRLFNKFFVIYNVGLIITLGSILVRGVTQILGIELGGMTHAISGIAGIGHILIVIAFIMLYRIAKASIDT